MSLYDRKHLRSDCSTIFSTWSLAGIDQVVRDQGRFERDNCPPFWFLSSRAKGPRGGCYVRSGGSSVQPSFGPFTSRICVLTGKVSGSAGQKFPAWRKWCNENVTAKSWPTFWSFATRICILSSDFGVLSLRSVTVDQLFGHLQLGSAFWARIWGPFVTVQ